MQLTEFALVLRQRLANDEELDVGRLWDESLDAFAAPAAQPITAYLLALESALAFLGDDSPEGEGERAEWYSMVSMLHPILARAANEWVTSPIHPPLDDKLTFKHFSNRGLFDFVSDPGVAIRHKCDALMMLHDIIVTADNVRALHTSAKEASPSEEVWTQLRRLENAVMGLETLSLGHSQMLRVLSPKIPKALRMWTENVQRSYLESARATLPPRPTTRAVYFDPQAVVVTALGDLAADVLEHAPTLEAEDFEAVRALFSPFAGPEAGMIIRDFVSFPTGHGRPRSLGEAEWVIRRAFIRCLVADGDYAIRMLTSVPMSSNLTWIRLAEFQDVQVNLRIPDSLSLARVSTPDFEYVASLARRYPLLAWMMLPSALDEPFGQRYFDGVLTLGLLAELEKMHREPVDDTTRTLLANVGGAVTGTGLTYPILSWLNPGASEVVLAVVSAGLSEAGVLAVQRLLRART